MSFEATADFAQRRDEADPLRGFRERFHFPEADGVPVVYLCGNSLGLQPRTTRAAVEAELNSWQRNAVEGHFRGDKPWFSYHEPFAEPAARLVGARPAEVVLMNSLTTNLHLLMASFYRPTAERFRIVIEGGAFPSDRYAVASQATFHGFDPQEAVVELQPEPGDHTLRTENIERWLADNGDSVALVMFSGVNYYTGQAFEMDRIAAAAHDAGAYVGLDLAHAVGNLQLQLHDWGVDFAAWCTYKYLNSGPGGVGGAFVHERHANAPELPRFAGWWGNDPTTRFEMPDRFVPQLGAAGWQLSNAPVLSLAAHWAALEIFDEAGMPRLRAKSLALTDYLFWLLDQLDTDRFEVITPRAAPERGGQISMLVTEDGRGLFTRLQERGVVCDFREPDVIRLAVAPLYNSWMDVFRFWEVLRDEA